MKINPSVLNSMFDKAGIDKSALYKALIVMGPKHLKTKQMRENWSEDNPTYCYCYVVSEMVYWYAPIETKPFSVKVIGDLGTHKFLKTENGDIIDLTAEQFPDYEDVDYQIAKHSPFMQTGKKGPSKRAKILADLMGFKENYREIK